MAVDHIAAAVAADRYELRDETYRDLRGRAAHFRAGEIGAVDRNKARLRRLALGLAFADRIVETVVHLFRQEIPQRPAIAFGVGGDDHLVGLTRAGDEMLGVESRIALRYGVETGGNCRARFRDALPALLRIDGGRRRRRPL